MKKLVYILSILAMTGLLVITSYAHSGRTDGSCGHYNYSTGKYHYHHGYPAHDHYDIDGDGKADCPYTIDREKQTEETEETVETVETVEKRPSVIKTLAVCMIVSGIIIFGSIIVSCIIDFFSYISNKFKN